MVMLFFGSESHGIHGLGDGREGFYLRDARHTLFSCDASNCRCTGKAAVTSFSGRTAKWSKLAKGPGLASTAHALLLVLVVQRQRSIITSNK